MSSSRSRSPFGRLLVILLVIALVWIFRTRLLTQVASFLIVEEKPVSSDLIVALGGGNGERELEAARLLREGMGTRILLTGGMRVLPGTRTTWADMMARQLSGLVPDSLVTLERRSTSTYEDATFVREDAVKMGARSVIVVTDPYHLRRTRAAFHHVFRGSGIRLAFVAPPSPWFRAEGWWRHEEATLAVFTEYSKLAFYAWHYHIWPWS